MVQALSRNGSQLRSAQAMPLLATKLFLPSPRPGLVSRQRLCQHLNGGLTRTLTLVSAPAGYGKTTLLAEWCATPPASALPFAWLSLDDGDNDPVRFWTYIVAALQTLQPGTGEDMLQAMRLPEPSPAEAVLPSLINDLTAIPQDFVLVLDDYHLLRTESIHRAMAFLLQHQPPQMHLVISSRTEPPLPLSLLRGRGQLTEVGEEALRFTAEEMAAFLRDTMGVDLPAEHAAALHELTEGWIAGLQMAAVSLQGQRDPAAFLAHFGGSHRHIADYLVEQVLERQPEDVQQFLLQTSILTRLCGPLCDALTEQGGGQAMLQRLEAANLFLIPLDDDRRWYRYQHLFGDLLRHRLQRLAPERVRALHGRAAAWLAQNGLAEEAIPHALGAEDYARAGDLIERVGDVVVVQRRELDTFLRWLQALPPELVRGKLSLRHWYFGALEQGGCGPQTLEPLTDDVEDLLSRAGTDADLDRDCVFMLATARIHALGKKGDLAQAVRVAERMRSTFPPDYFVGDCLFNFLTSLGKAYLYNGDVLAAEREFLLLARHFDVVQLAGIGWGEIQWLRGHLHRAAATLSQHVERARAGHPWPAGALGDELLAELHYEWNDLTGAVEHLARAVAVFRRWDTRLPLVQACWRLAQAYHAQGEGALADQMAQQARRAMPDTTEPGWWYTSRGSVQALQAQFCLQQGRLDAADQWAAASGLSLDDDPGYRRLWDYWVLAQVAVARGQPARAMPLLARLRKHAETQGRTHDAIQTMALQAVALHAQGQIDEAAALVAETLALAEPEGYLRTFLDMGDPMAQLLRRVASPYATRLLAAFAAPSAADQPDGTPPAELLSERELDVLRLVAQGLSNHEIAERLIITPGTVTGHLNHIYGKLDVHSRIQAVAEARARNLKL